MGLLSAQFRSEQERSGRAWGVASPTRTVGVVVQQCSLLATVQQVIDAVCTDLQQQKIGTVSLAEVWTPTGVCGNRTPHRAVRASGVAPWRVIAKEEEKENAQAACSSSSSSVSSLSSSSPRSSPRSSMSLNDDDDDDEEQEEVSSSLKLLVCCAPSVRARTCYRVMGSELHACTGCVEDPLATFMRASHQRTFGLGEGTVGRAFQTRRAVAKFDLAHEGTALYDLGAWQRPTTVAICNSVGV